MKDGGTPAVPPVSALDPHVGRQYGRRVETLKLLVREGTRRNVASLAAVALLLMAALGAGLASIEIAGRTERAYPDYLRRADVGNLVVNPSLDTAEAEEMIRSTPGVLSVTSDSLLTVAVNDNASNQLQTRMSPDGRYTTQDRPVVHEGRMIQSGAEAFFSREAAVELERAQLVPGPHEHFLGCVLGLGGVAQHPVGHVVYRRLVARH